MADVKKLEAELAELTAANEAATSWGAAVGAREERIKNIHSELRRLRASPRLPLREYTAFRFSAPTDSCKCGKCQLVPHATVAHYADLIDRITAERDGLRKLLERIKYSLTKNSLTDSERVSSALTIVRAEIETFAVSDAEKNGAA